MRNSSLLTLLGATLLVAVMAQPVQAATPPPSLAGEQFASSTNATPGFGGSAAVISKTCGPDGTGTLTFSADGNATGPYPGTFHEDGTVELVGGLVTRADATFFITSSAGAVSGTKSFDTSANPTGSTGNCTVDANNFLNFQSSQSQTYSAAITVSQGRFSDSGTGASTFQTSFQGTTANPTFLNTFTEGFSASNGVTGKVNPVVTTRATPSAHTGGTISDTATLAGGNSPTGTLTFDVFDPSNDTCTGTSFFQSTVQVSGNGVYPSGPFPAVLVGIYRWVVTYSGDANNSAVTTACSNPNEISVVTLTTPTITTSATATANTPGPVSDTATLARGNAPTGTITFSLFGVDDTTCIGPPLQSFVAVTDNGTYASGPFAAPLPGTYRWIASYGGDSNNTKATTACNETTEISVVTKTSPTISTLAIASVNMGALISDTATLSGGNAPGGSIHFQLFGPSDPTCTSAIRDSFKSVNGNLSYTSDVVLATAPGIYRWIATYSGDSNNNSATTACGDAGEISRVKANPTITTQATASVIVGGAIADIATLDGGLAPTGTITFSVFGTSDCSGTALFNSARTVTGNGLYTSDSFTPTSPGTYSWVASYDGDADNNAVTTACNAAGETSSVIKASPTITTQATGSAIMGGTISDAATLAGGVAPTGAISYMVFGPNDATCTGTPTFLTKPVAGNGVYTSDPFTPVSPGTYRWVTAYSGDANNNPAPTACNDLNETSVVAKASPTITTQATATATIGGTISDTATLAGGSGPTGTITFSLFGSADCSGSALFNLPQTVAGDGPYASGPFTPLAPGTYSWVAAYSGDANNNGVSTACSDANETSKVIKASPSISTLATATATMGGTISDTATLSGGTAPTGIITFNLFGTADCSGPSLFNSPQPVTSAGTYASGSFTPLAPGTYRWLAAYSGDANNNPATSLCTDATEVSVVSKASPTMSTSATISATIGGTIADTATLLGGNAATGTITFSVFGTADCSGTALFNSPLTVAGDGTYASGPFTPLAPGTYSWVAAYSGDANNNGVTTPCNAANETSNVIKASPTISTQATTTATMGGTISDTATLLGGNATAGTITFSLFATDCSGTAVFSSTIPVSTTGSSVSNPFTPTAPGTYRWVAVYSGDANNNAASTACGDLNETSVVAKASPTISTQATSATIGGSVSDTATLLGGSAATGTITFSVFGTADCSGTALYNSTQTIAGDGAYASGPFTPAAPGTYTWVAAYSGDANNNGVVTPCNAANETSNVIKASPSISTLATATATVGGTIADTATLSGGHAPAGTITFSLFTTPDCSGTALFTSTTPVSTTGNVSDPFTPTATGTYRWLAAYSGDVNNNPATSLCTDTAEVSVVTKASPSISTLATARATMGGTISDTATLFGGALTGTITFSLFATPDCSGPSLFTSSIPVSSTGNNVSNPFTPTAPGTYRWLAVYSGDANNNPATSLCTDATEVSVVSKANPTMSTSATISATIGGTIADTATLLGGNAATGTITFSVFGTADCSGTALFNSPLTVAGDGTYSSGPFTPLTPGAYNWVAAYSGDANNNGVTTPCNAANETSNVSKASPTISTQATPSALVGGSISDTATVSGGNAPTGTIAFSLFGPDDATCTGSMVFNSTMPVSGNSSTSAAFLPKLVGAYSWVAAYSGDANNNGVTTACGDANETSNVSQARPTISTQATVPALTGGSTSDTATLSGGNAPTGIISFSLFGPNDATCAGPALFNSIMPVIGSSSTSAAFVPTLSGTYSWVAAYSGDTNNSPATTACNDPGETFAVVIVARLTIVTQATASANTGGTISDTATLAGGNSPTGAVTFSLFGPDNAGCTGPPVFTSTKPVSGNGSYPSDAFTAVLPGAYRWVAAYTGDANNSAATTACNDAGETSTVTTVGSQDVNLVMFNVGGFSTGHLGAYIVIVTNTGKVPTTGTLTFTDTLPAGLTYAGSFTFGWNCSVAGQTVTCTYAHSLPVNGLTAFALFVTVTAPGGTVLTNTATVTPLDATPADNTASVTVTVWHSRRSGNFDPWGHNESDDSSQSDSSRSASAEGPSRGRD